MKLSPALTILLGVELLALAFILGLLVGAC